MTSLSDSPVMGLKRFDTDDPFVNTEVNFNTDLIDTLPPTICTSGSRPVTNLYNGRLIWEADTKRLYEWTGLWQLLNDVGPWTTYAGDWNASGTAPAIGNGSIASRSKEIGKTVDWQTRVTIGSTTTVGTGIWSWIIPATIQAAAVGIPVGYASIFDVSAGGLYAGIAVTIANTSVGVIDAGLGTRWGVATPVTLATGDIITVGGTYERA